MIDKLRELFSNWMKEKKWRKDVGDPLYVYEVYEFLDYIERKEENEITKSGNAERRRGVKDDSTRKRPHRVCDP